MPHPSFVHVATILGGTSRAPKRSHSILAIMKPTIGIPQCLDANGRIRSGRDYLYIDIAYARDVERAGGIPLHLPIQEDVAGLISRVDGLLLPGGDDFLPGARYPKDVSFDPAPEMQIEFDTGLLAAALERQLPVFGICYGAQLIARYLGGTLHHHLPIDLPSADNHQLPEATGRHRLEIQEGSLLAKVLGPGRHEVNSLHHQAIADTGPQLIVAARAPDGVIEAVESPGPVFCLGVQWHPEKLGDAASQSLFAAFTQAAAKHERPPTQFPRPI